MKRLGTILVWLLLLAAVVLGVLFGISNTVRVPLNLLVVELPEMQVGLWVILSFVLGGIAGMLVSLGLVLRLRTSLGRAQRQLRAAQRQSNQAAPTPGAAEPAGKNAATSTNGEQSLPQTSAGA